MKLGTVSVDRLMRAALLAALLWPATAGPSRAQASAGGSNPSTLAATGPAAAAAPAEAAAATKVGATAPFEQERAATGAVPGGTAGTGIATGTPGPGVFPQPGKLTYEFGKWPPDISTHGAEIQTIYNLIFAVTGAVFFITEALLIWFLYRYRAQPGQKAIYLHGHTGLEIGWTLLPIVVFVWLGISSADLWSRLKDRSKFPDKDVFHVQVTAQQFEWLIRYPGADGKFGNDDDLETNNDLHVPYGKPVRVQLTANDVIHSFFIPELRVKQDALPGMMTEIWFQATQPAEIELACAELCGLGHYRMRGLVKIDSPEATAQWIQAEKEDE